MRGICRLDRPRGTDEYFLASIGRLTYVAATIEANHAPCTPDVARVTMELILRRARSSAG